MRTEQISEVEEKRMTRTLCGALVALVAVLLVAAAPSVGQGGAPKCQGQTATIAGTPDGESLRGTPGRDVIVGLGGADKIRAGGGKDLVCGGHGRDLLFGNADADRLYGRAENDFVKGGGGSDSVVGGTGPDTLQGDGQRDLCLGGAPTEDAGNYRDLADRTSCEKIKGADRVDF